MRPPFPRLAIAGATLFILLFASLFFAHQQLAPPVQEPFALESAEPTAGTVGQPLNIDLSGRGFDRKTRVALKFEPVGVKSGYLSLPIWGLVRRLAVEGNLAYVSNQHRGVQVVDLAAPGGPQLLGTLKTRGSPWGITLSEGRAYVADQFEGLFIADISSPTRPQFLGAADLGGYAVDVALQGTVAFVANSRIGLQAVDVADPHRPQLLSTLNLPGKALAVKVRNNYAYLATGPSGLVTVDIRDPRKMRMTGWSSAPHPFLADLDLRDDKIYAVGSKGLLIYDGVNPENPRLRVHLQKPAGIGIALAGDHAYIATSRREVVRINIEDPLHPQFLDPLPISRTAMSIVADTAAQRILVAAGEEGIFAFGMGKEWEPSSELEQVPAIEDLAVQDGYAYIVTNSHRFLIFDLRGEKPRLLAAHPTRCQPERIRIGGRLAVLWGGSPECVEVVDISNPGAPQQLGILEKDLREAASNGNQFYLSLIKGGLEIYQVDKDNSLQRIGEAALQASSLLARDNLLYAGGTCSNLQILSLDTSPPRLIGATSLPWHLQRGGKVGMIAVSGLRAYLAAGESGLLIYDIADPLQPRLVSALPDENAAGVTIHGNYLYLATRQNGIKIFSLANGDSPAEVAILPGALDKGGIGIDRGRIIFINDRHMLEILPHPDPAIRIDIKSGKRLRAVLPPPERGGLYSLQVFKEGGRTIQQRAIRVGIEEDLPPRR